MVLLGVRIMPASGVTCITHGLYVCMCCCNELALSGPVVQYKTDISAISSMWLKNCSIYAKQQSRTQGQGLNTNNCLVHLYVVAHWVLRS